MDILWYIVQKMGCFDTLICPQNNARKCICRPSGSPKNPKDTISSKSFSRAKVGIAMAFSKFGSPEIYMMSYQISIFD